MGKKTGIEWTDSTWNPWMGCTKVSQGCKNCYMFREQERYGHDPSTLRRSKTTFEDPLKWKDPRRIFVCSWSDFFHEDVPWEWRKEAYDIMFECSHHTFLILTKRPWEIGRYMSYDWWEIVDNAWLGITAENQETFIKRMPYLAKIPAAKKFVSAEPLLGMLDISQWVDEIDWIIVGGESGANARIMLVEWVEEISRKAYQNDIPYFFKQWGEWIPELWIKPYLLHKEKFLASPHLLDPRGISENRYYRLGRKKIKELTLAGSLCRQEFPDDK